MSAAPRSATPRRIPSVLLWLLAGLIFLAVAGVLAFRFAVQQLQSQVLQALGPRGSVEAVEVGWSGLELRGLRVQGLQGGAAAWPTADELHAARVHVVPELRSLLSSEVRIRSVVVQDAYLSVLRGRDGKVQVLPGLRQPGEARVLPEQAGLAGAASGPGGASGADADAPRRVRIGSLRLENAALEFFDASVRRPAHRIRIEQLAATVDDLLLPELNAPMQVDLHGVIKGPQRDGTLAVQGSLTPATRDAALTGQLAGVDLVALQPYLMRVNEGGVKRGTLDLSFQADVQANRLRAPGKLVLTGLELNSGGAMGTFAGVPRQAVLAAMSRNGRIELDFTLEGRLDDPKFSINEQFALRVAAGLAETLGVSLGGVVEGVGSMIKGLFGR